MRRRRLLALAFTLLCLSFGATGCRSALLGNPEDSVVTVGVASAKDAAVAGNSVITVDGAAGKSVDMSSSPKPFGLQYNGSIRIAR